MDKNRIGENAGLLWRLMNERHNKRVWNMEDLRQASGLNVADFYASIGWLARENKVDFSEDGITHQKELVGLVVEYFH